ncbi:hypothetical protein CFIO01_07108 [Colletotrichum fioriniae PJ7]|uniref:Uncharacterized protein n=1 Tax=Colletotrichum fioriniae PJ7 TaxID=1445577 RepID=A0A010R4Q2_9PEZI|nr:hypothetical protein CFIO01_07108 [Colletotrichum fioriniae PJ7]
MANPSLTPSPTSSNFFNADIADAGHLKKIQTQRNGKENGTTRVKNTPTQTLTSQALTPICHWLSGTLALWHSGALHVPARARPPSMPPAPAAGRTRDDGQ